jgi:uncharacterized DUF497 family protein
MRLKFEWDEEKNAVNVVKHGISFETAKMAFFDPLYIDLSDEPGGGEEDRWKVFGLYGRVLLVIRCVEKGGRIHIISARRATKREKEKYFYGHDTGYGN